MRKVILATLLVVVMVTSGCSQKNNVNKKDNTVSYERVELFSDVEFWKPPLWNEEEGTITGDISKKVGLAIDINVPAQDADMQLSLRLINNELPDIISVTDSTVISQLVTSGKVWNFEDFIKKYKPDSHLLVEFPEDIKNELIKRDGGWYAFPSHINSADSRKIWKMNSQYFEDVILYSENNAIIWNKKILEMAGLSLEDLQTEEDVLSAFRKVQSMGLTIDGDTVIPLLLDGKDYMDSSMKYLENTFGAEYIDEEGNYKDPIQQPETKEALHFLNKTIREGYLQPENLAISNLKIQEYIASGRVLCFIGNIANTGFDGTQWISSGAIMSNDGSCPVLGKNYRASTGWINTFIAKDCDNPELIADWIDYMTSEEGMLLWCFGYEGEYYIKSKDNLIIRTDIGNYAKNAYSQSGIGAWWPFFNSTWERSVSQEPKADSEDALRSACYFAYAKEKETSIYDSSLLYIPEKLLAQDDEIGGIVTAVEEWKKEQIPVVIMAATDTEFEKQYKIMLQKLINLDIDKINKVKDNQYNLKCEEYDSVINKVN